MDTKYKAQILIVDDNLNNLFTLKSLLNEHIDVTVIEANSGNNALHCVAQYPIDLIILDIQMPEIDGFEVAEILSSRKKTRDIPIVFLTAAYKSEDFRQKGFAVGAADYLTKPIDPEQLLSRIRTYLHFIEREHSHTQALRAANQHLRNEVEERKQAQTALSLLSRQNQLILDSTEEGIFGMALDGTIAFLNPAAAKMLGYTPEEMLGKPQHEMIHYSYENGRAYPPNDCPVCHMLSANSKPKSQRINNEVFWRKDGTAIPVEYIAAPLIDSNEVIGCVMSFSDITLRKEVETSLRQAKKAAELANQTKTQFLANVSHELRTPLNAIIGYSEILSEDFCDQIENDTLFNDYLNDMEKILAAGQRLLDLIDNILDISNIESGKTKALAFCNESVPLIPLLQNINETIKPWLAENNNVFQLEYSEDIGYLFTDVKKVRQTLLSLIRNACTFTQKGQIKLQVKRHIETQTEWLYFAVIDNGVGIAVDKQDKVFQAFSQEDASSTRQHDGMGLGLALAKHFAEMMGGHIAIESEENKGCTFTLGLPAQVHSQITDEPETERLYQTGQNKVIT